MTPLVHCYCYYRIAPPHAEAARTALSAAFRNLEQRFGVVGRLLRGETDAFLWMEIYENVRDPQRLELALAELLAAERFFACLAPGSERRMERFVAAG